MLLDSMANQGQCSDEQLCVVFGLWAQMTAGALHGRTGNA
jgi:hypothetical protein